MLFTVSAKHSSAHTAQHLQIELWYAGAAVVNIQISGDDVTIYINNPKKELQVVFMGMSMLSNRQLPEARQWLQETAAQHKQTGSCRNLRNDELRRLIMAFVPNPADGVTELQARLLQGSGHLTASSLSVMAPFCRMIDCPDSSGSGGI